MSLTEWWKARVRTFGPGAKSPDGWYVRLTPNLGFSLPWFGGRRLRWAPHHGLQLVEWSAGVTARGEPTGRWIVTRQVLGRSTVKGERYASVRAPGV